MRLPYALAVTGGLVLTTAISAQTAPTPSPTPAPTRAQPGQTQPAPTQAQPALTPSSQINERAASGANQPPAAQPALTPSSQINSYPPSLYQTNGVSKSLNLTQDQTNNLNKLTEQTQSQFRDQYNKLNSLNDADRIARLQELNQQYYGAWNKGAQNILNENQRLRYQQLNYQYGGFSALNDPDVQKRLNMTPAQAKDLRENTEWNNQQLQQINRLASTDPTKAASMYNNYLKEHQERLNKYLTPEQQKTWREMTGEPYTFQPSFTPSR